MKIKIKEFITINYPEDLDNFNTKYKELDYFFKNMKDVKIFEKSDLCKLDDSTLAHSFYQKRKITFISTKKIK